MNSFLVSAESINLKSLIKVSVLSLSQRDMDIEAVYMDIEAAKLHHLLHVSHQQLPELA